VKSVYLAGPIAGMTEREAKEWRSDAIDYFRKNGITGISPLRNEPAEHGKYGDALSWVGKAAAEGQAIAAKNMFDVRACDMTLIYLPKAANDMRPSYGTVIELGWARILDKPVVLVSDDPVVMAHPCINTCVGWKVETLAAGFVLVVEILGPYA
jgi:nucleoside 2-deoxyribosyltransferase